VPLNLRLPPDLNARLETLGAALADACPAIEFAFLFGSAGTERMTPTSDVDIAIAVADDAEADDVRLDAIGAVTEHLGTDAVDVVVLNDAPIALAGRILLSRRVILERRPFRRHLFESRTLREFHDFRIREHRILEARFARQ
jgi:predicted nucleotidyltransferase